MDYCFFLQAQGSATCDSQFTLPGSIRAPLSEGGTSGCPAYRHQLPRTIHRSKDVVIAAFTWGAVRRYLAPLLRCNRMQANDIDGELG